MADQIYMGQYQPFLEEFSKNPGSYLNDKRSELSPEALKMIPGKGTKTYADFIAYVVPLLASMFEYQTYADLKKKGVKKAPATVGEAAGWDFEKEPSLSPRETSRALYKKRQGG